MSKLPTCSPRCLSLILCFSVHATSCLTHLCYFASVCLHQYVSSCVSLPMLPCCLYHLCLPAEDSSDEENTPVLNRFTRKFNNNVDADGMFQMAVFVFVFVEIQMLYFISFIQQFLKSFCSSHIFTHCNMRSCTARCQEKIIFFCSITKLYCHE